VIKRKLAGVYGPNLKFTKPADCLTDRSANQTHPTRGLLILVPPLGETLDKELETKGESGLYENQS
jgi:hypothetical protein